MRDPETGLYHAGISPLDTIIWSPDPNDARWFTDPETAAIRAEIAQHNHDNGTAYALVPIEPIQGDANAPHRPGPC